MKKVIFFVISFAISAVYADRTLNLDTHKINCGNYTLSSKTTASDIVKNCPVEKLKTKNHLVRKETTVKFRATTEAIIKCEYHGNKLDECKIDD